MGVVLVVKNLSQGRETEIIRIRAITWKILNQKDKDPNFQKNSQLKVRPSTNKNNEKSGASKSQQIPEVF